VIAKEVRAVLPAWLACAAVMIAAQQAGRGYDWLAAPAYFIGSAAIGALAVGHEYIHGTMAAQLMLPVSRSRIWAAKLTVAAGMLSALALLAVWTLKVSPVLAPDIYWLSAAAGLFVATWLTLLSGSALAGTVFTLSGAGLLMIALQAIGIRLYGYTAEVDAFRLTFMTRVIVALSACGAGLGWRRFVTLEAPDERRAHVQFTPRTRSARQHMTRRHPMVALIAKELRLQQLPFVLTGIYVLGFSVIALSIGSIERETVIPLTLLYSALQSILIGALPGAEERQLGTHDAQLLLPVAASRQWLVKSGTAITLTLLLGIGVPALMTALPLSPIRLALGPLGLFTPRAVTTLLAFTAFSLYVSSVATNALRALLIAIPAMVAVVLFVGRVSLAVRMRIPVVLEHGERGLRTIHRSNHVAAFILLACVVALVLRFALDNQRWSRPPVGRMAIHVLSIAGAIVAAFSAAAMLGAL